MRQEIIEEIEKILPAKQIFQQEPMKLHTTFRVGGNAAVFLEIENAGQLQELVALFHQNNTKYFVIGNGSNLLVADEGYDGVILHIASGMKEICVKGEKMSVQAGALLGRTAAAAMEYSLTGLEFASGIPGSVGGAVIMNAGAYGGEMSQVVSIVRGISPDGGTVEYGQEELMFGYRTSLLKQCHIIVTEVEFLLKKGIQEEIRAKMEDLAARRREKQPLEFASAGSTFKRPEGYFAGKLIMDAGLRGYSVGDAQVSEKHCGFIINKGNATADDIKRLMKEIQDKVKAQSGVELEPEVIFLR